MIDPLPAEAQALMDALDAWEETMPRLVEENGITRWKLSTEEEYTAAFLNVKEKMAALRAAEKAAQI